MLHAKESSWDLSLRWVSGGNSILRHCTDSRLRVHFGSLGTRDEKIDPQLNWTPSIEIATVLYNTVIFVISEKPCLAMYVLLYCLPYILHLSSWYIWYRAIIYRLIEVWMYKLTYIGQCVENHFAYHQMQNMHDLWYISKCQNQIIFV